MSSRVALVTGITGQDGAYLAQFLLNNNYYVVGGFRRTSGIATWRLEELGIANRVKLMPLDLLEYNNVLDVVRSCRPDEIYNLAAQSFVGVSFAQPISTTEVTGVGALRLLNAALEVVPEAAFYQASTSEMFGGMSDDIQNECTPFHPRSPYGYAKLLAHWAVVNAREAHGLRASCGILFNHESPLRGTEFVTRKITSTLAGIYVGERRVLQVGNIAAKRDWGYAPDYVAGMWQMLQGGHGDDYVLATGVSHSVLDFIHAAANTLDMNLVWNGDGPNAEARDSRSGKVIVRVDPSLYRPAEVTALRGDSGKARRSFGWAPRLEFAELVEVMVKADVDRARRGAVVSGVHGG